MAVDLQALGIKLRHYREQLEESLADVSIATGIGTERLASIEEGLIRPSGDELLILADHWTCDFQTFLSDKRPSILACWHFIAKAIEESSPFLVAKESPKRHCRIFYAGR